MKVGFGLSLGVFAAVSRSVPAAPQADFRALPGLSQADVIQWVAGLGLVIGLILISAWILRRINQVAINQHNRMKIVGGLAVGARERVVLLQVGEKQLLLGVAPGRVETLHVLDPEEVPETIAEVNQETFDSETFSSLPGPDTGATK